MEVLGLLKSKQACLRLFLESTQDFARRAQAGDFSGLEAFERARGASLKALGLFDRKLNEAVGALAAAERFERLRAEIEASLDAQAELLAEIFRLDAQVVRLIEAEQLRLLREIAAADRNKDVMSRFKSGVDAGAGLAGLDRTV